MEGLVNMKTLISLALLLTLAQPAQAAGQAMTVIRDGSKPAFEYRHDPAAFKPYVAQLYTPAGVAVLRDNVPDHKHHHGLMFAVAADGVDFWSETEKCGRQVQREFSTNAVGIVQNLDWTSPAAKVVLSEERTIRLERECGVTLVTWRTRLATPPGKECVELTGAPYFGLGARFVPAMDKVGTFLHSSATTAACWCAYTSPVGDKSVTFAIFDYPANVRHPAQMFTMTAPFAYLSATMNLCKEPLVLKAGQPLDLRYGVALWDGRPDRNEIEKLYRHWLKLQ